ncbi:NUDIX domain-containing protein [Actinoplanes sp. NPDC051470]|uniref:DUF7674 family protein n=1 Tax=unclassified Actinoplanes TaxID=2626549 RepID=UPI00343E467A
MKPDVSCVFVCHDDAGRILLARRSAGARDEPGAWDCGAGAIEFGETFEQAVTREVTEEYGTPPLSITQRGVRNILRTDPPSHWVAVVFSVRLDARHARIGEPHKFDELGWFTADRLPFPLHSQFPETLALLAESRDLSYEGVIRSLVREVPELREALAAHIASHGEVLQHVFLDLDVTPFVLAAWRAGDTELVRRCLYLLEDAMTSTDPRTRGLAAAFVEGVQPWDPAVKPFVALWPAALSRQAAS